MAITSVLIRIPATVGNFAGALDCAALALDASLNVKVTPRSDGAVGIRYFGVNGERVPRDRSNLIVRAMEAALHLKELEFTGADFEIYSSIPVGVGLGSSTAAVLAGLQSADSLLDLGLDEKTLFEIASIYESRCDNLRAAWAGGYVARSDGDPSVSFRHTVVPENFLLHVVVPQTSLVPGARRERPSSRLFGKDLSAHFQRAALLAEFFARPGKSKGLDLDTPLPPTCEKSVAGLEEALRVRARSLLSVFACGSGPAVGILVHDNPSEAVGAVRECFTRHGVPTTVAEFRPTNAGAREWNAVRPEITLPAATALASTGRKSTLIPV